MKTTFFIRSIFLLLTLTLTHISQAQFSRKKFGKNRIQYRQFDWRYITTPNFEIYYYEGGYELAVLSAKLAEEDISRITETVGFSPFTKIKLYIYQSITDLQQSNIGVKQQGLEVGGQTNFVRSEVEVAFTGNKYTLRQELARGIGDMLIFEMMYGGSLKELLQSSYLLNLPEWFMAGAAKYIAEGWSADMDNYMRNLLMEGELRRPDKYTDEEAVLVGQSIWNFIAERYGKNTIGNLLNLTRIVRNEENSIQNTLGIAYEVFIKNWREYYQKQATEVGNSHQRPENDMQVSFVNKGVDLGKLRISPDTTWIAYTENIRGRYQVRLYHIPTRQSSKLLSGGYKVINQESNNQIPLIAWKDKATLAVVSTRKGKNVLELYDIEKKKRLTRESFAQFSHINSIDIAGNGELAVMSAELETHSNIYQYNFRTSRVSKVTDDNFDCIDPKFIPETQDIVFASNRNNDTLSVKSGSVKDFSKRFHLFIYSKGNKVLERITNTYSYDFNPIPVSKNQILFLSDQRGISHLYSYNRRSKVATQVTGFGLDMTDADLNAGMLTFTMLKNGQEQIFLKNSFNPKVSSFTGKTLRRMIGDLRMLEELKKERKEQEDAKQREAARKKKEEDDKKQEQEDKLKSSYEFDSFNKSKRKKFIKKFNNQPASVKVKNVDNLDIGRSEPYENRFTTDNFVTSLILDPLRSVYGSGLGIVFEMEMTDLRENHKVNGGLFGLTNLNNSSFYAEYEYLKHRLDYRIRYDMKNLEIANDFSIFFQRYRYHYLEAAVSYPLNITSRITATPFVANTRYIIAGTPGLLNQPDATRTYVGGRLSFVFDNSRITGMNMLNGTKFRAGLEVYRHSQDASEHFANVEMEARHYQKIYKSLVLATRVSFGHYFGAAPKSYILGGMNNWIGSATEQRGSTDVLTVEPEQGIARDMTPLLFSRFVTSMRGFNYNAMNGNSHLLLNAELRLPLLRFFYKGTVASSFFRNLQLAGFTDMGAAWTGTSPFNRKNAVNTIEIPRQGAFSGSVTNFSNPFLIGYGFGARTMVLSYYMKFDVAWGLEANQRTDAKFYVTLGYDF